MTTFLGLYNYWIVIILMMIGLYTLMAQKNLIKKVIGINIFQTSVILFYISMGKIHGGTAPILTGDEAAVYSNPLPHVLMLTAIVVGVATTALALSLVTRIHEVYGTLEDDEILAHELSDEGYVLDLEDLLEDQAADTMSDVVASDVVASDVVASDVAASDVVAPDVAAPNTRESA